MDRQQLTNRQQDIYEFIRDAIQNGCSPTVREIGSHFGITSPNGVICNLKAIQEKGYITRDGAKSRSIRLVEDGKTLREAVGEMLEAADFCKENCRPFIPTYLKEHIEEVRKAYKRSA